MRRVLDIVVAGEELVRSGRVDAALMLYRELTREYAIPQWQVGADDELNALRARVASWLRQASRDELSQWRLLQRRLLRATLAGAAVAAALWALLPPRDVSEGAHWSTSSALPGSSANGELPRSHLLYSPPEYFFHTQADHTPFITIDLGRERNVSSVQIWNRLICCRERASNISIEVGIDGHAFHRIASRSPTNPSSLEWFPTFPPVKARFVRIVGNRDTPLHLSDIRVFGS